ncbi:hypothetical protein THMIRHAM_12880 [Thiomicrorhabdus immobilis]|uniref:Uncharacterized protein n=1 Tax=Thiomicrorhabdus immobilis TaxID=2791037 RepID=A0ABM7MDQ1_9GAMM|nr:hypothetical protein THMIRHAM_12880 [Thiomicrorhabdus immobilis]
MSLIQHIDCTQGLYIGIYNEWHVKKVPFIYNLDIPEFCFGRKGHFFKYFYMDMGGIT